MSLLGMSITPADREAWLAERQTGIGASEAAAALGVSPWETELGLYLRKTGAADPIVENQAMRWGTRLEPLIAEAYAEETGMSFMAEQIFARSEAHPFMLCTLDRVRVDGRVIELKTVGARGAAEWGEAGTDEIPQHYLCQVLHQLIVTETDVADVAVLIGGQDFRIYTIHRDDQVAQAMIERESAFWDCVLTRQPPPVNYARDGSLLSWLYPGSEGEIELDPIEEQFVNDWQTLGAEIKAKTDARDQAKARLLDVMKEAASARLSDGRVVTRKVVEVKPQVIERKGYTYVDCRLKAAKGTK